ncbi:hypothetical protein P4S73_29135 [Paraglaciecola sp. Hal342]
MTAYYESHWGNSSELTFSGYVTGHHVCVANRIEKAVFDRCIIDPLAYQALYAPNKQLCFDGIQRYIDRFNETYSQSHLYDDIVLLRHPKDASFIKMWSLQMKIVNIRIRLSSTLLMLVDSRLVSWIAWTSLLESLSALYTLMHSLKIQMFYEI